MRSFFSGFSSGVTLGANGSNAAYIKSLLEYDFRILLRLGSKKSDYVVAVDSSFEKIHVVSQSFWTALDGIPIFISDSRTGIGLKRISC